MKDKSKRLRINQKESSVILNLQSEWPSTMVREVREKGMLSVSVFCIRQIAFEVKVGQLNRNIQ